MKATPWPRFFTGAVLIGPRQPAPALYLAKPSPDSRCSSSPSLPPALQGASSPVFRLHTRRCSTSRSPRRLDRLSGGRRKRIRPVLAESAAAAATVSSSASGSGSTWRRRRRHRRRLLRRHRRRRISSGQSPYGHMPIEDSLKPCGPADSSGEIRERIQTNGRCESANERGDTYGPVAYEAYLPEVRGLRLEREVGQPARRARDVDHLGRPLPDRACARRPALRRLPALGDARVRVGRVPVHGVRARIEYDDAIMPAFLIWGFWLVSSPWAQGAFSALGGVDEVRRAAHRAALAVVSGGDEGRAAEAQVPRRVPRGDARRFLCAVPGAEPAPRRPRLLGSAPSGGRLDESRPSHCGTGGSTTRRAFPTCTPRSGCSRGCSCSAWSSRTSCPGERALSSSPR